LLTSEDVVRHRLVAEIVDAYGRYDESRQPTVIARGPRPVARTSPED